MQPARTTARHAAAILLCGVASLLPALAHAATLNSDGLHEEPWFLLDSFLELEDDWQRAAQSGRHFAVLWELRGCPLCQRLHDTLLADPAIAARMAQQIAVLQLNIIGSRRVTDFAGTVRAERDLAAHFGIAGTPTFQVFARHAQAEAPREVLRISGVPAHDEFQAMLTYVHSRAYRTETFEQYRQRTHSSRGRSQT